ncbi:adenylate cyclase type 10-like [Bombus vosnesenskii]|uniref:Adenylate cyclase type 10-like n=1 Tax=Bombus vosnesenskii TaxID=207650 RepID=A0A6J3LNQ4_9HYME|nr:adenylate cyclase type 10-like [Bombus vosnesenskii]
MCPDEILDHYDDYNTRMYYTTLMLGDISGFTDLAEKYTKTGKGGPSKLTETLNSYIGAMVQEILSHNGDVLKFSGDAFIVMWKLHEGMMMRDLAIAAMQTACIIQKHFGSYDTEVGVTLKVKLAIASGKTYFTSIGDPESMSHYIITGTPVWDVKFAEGLCRGGDILVAPSSWQWANPNEYVHETLPDGIHTLIISCTSMWYQAKVDESIIIRPKVIKAAQACLKEALRSYMLRPVIRSTEMDEPLEYLTEMRQVVILFINVITSNVGKKQLIALVNFAYKLVCKIVDGMHGCVNKTSLFDKDLMFLCVFGLRGDKHELESQIGLRCASKLRSNLIAIENVKSVTVGVTTGVTYCGVVGHILRREYTVIGISVNKAARLMVAYRDKVVCDRESFLNSHLEARHFILQEPRYLKGITNIGPIYEFQEQPKYIVSDIAFSKYPLLGRTEELKIFRKMLMRLLEYSKRTKKNRGARPKYNTLIIKGDPRIGKTRLLDEFTQNIPVETRYNYISLQAGDNKAPYNLVHLLFSMPLGFTRTSTRKEREDKLLLRLGKMKHTYYLCVFNQPFNVHFSITHRYNALTDMDKQKLLRKFLLKLMKGCFEELWVVIIDDAEYVDRESLEIFDVLTKRDKIFFALTIGRKLNTDFPLYLNFLHRAKVIELIGIDKWYHAGLACQILNVNGLPAELEKLIQERSFGNPGWIESYLVSLLQVGGLEIVNITKREANIKGYDSMISLLEEDMMTLKKPHLSIDNEETIIAICNIAENFMYEDVDPEITMDAVTKLFEIRVFGCAIGDFSKNAGPIVFIKNMRNPNSEMDVFCKCIGLTIPGNIEKTLTALLEFAEICLMNCNIPQARKLLSESETVLVKLFESNEDEIVLLPYLTAKIQTLQGQCFLESGSIFEAEGSLKMALKNLGYRFPKLEMMIDLSSLTQLMNLKIKLICPKKTELLNSLEGDNVDYTKQLSECLAQMFELFRFKGMKKHARLAAMWGLNAALESNKDLYILCTSFTNMLITAHMYQDRYIVPYLEQRAINICNESRETLEAQELNVIVQLYTGIFFSRWIRGQISKAIQIGFICSRMASAIGSTFLKLVVLPRLIHLLMISCRHPEVVTQLRELEFISHHNFDKSGRTWYYALCADVHLDTGLTILPFQACEQYFLQEGEQMISLHDPEAERRYFTSMWLWCIRTEEWEAAKVWSGRNVESINIMDEHIVAATITALKKLEGLLILYVHKLNSRNADAAITMMEIKSIFKDTKKMSKIVEIVIPRYMLLKAYYWMIKSQKSNAIKILKKLQKVCKKMENKMIYAWALHCEKAWSGGISSVHTDKWREIANSKILDKWDEINVNNSNMIIFTFPLPKYLL